MATAGFERPYRLAWSPVRGRYLIVHEPTNRVVATRRHYLDAEYLVAILNVEATINLTSQLNKDVPRCLFCHAEKTKRLSPDQSRSARSDAKPAA